MHTSSICALAALFGAALAAPLNKRDVVWVTDIEVDIVTVPVTETVWVDYPGETAEAVAWHSHTWSAATTTTAVAESTTSAYSAPTTSSTSVYVAPTTESTSAYVAPTTTSSSEYVAPTTTSTSVYVAPTTTSSSVYVAPTTESPTSTYVAPTTYAASTTTTSSTAAAATSASSGSVYTGADLTYYTPGLGSCGETNTDSDAIVALAHEMMTDGYTGSNPNDNPLCNKQISITYGGVTKTATIVDTCPGCDGTSLDLTLSLFEEFGAESAGRLHDASWVFV